MHTIRVIPRLATMLAGLIAPRLRLDYASATPRLRVTYASITPWLRSPASIVENCRECLFLSHRDSDASPVFDWKNAFFDKTEISHWRYDYNTSERIIWYNNIDILCTMHGITITLRKKIWLNQRKLFVWDFIWFKKPSKQWWFTCVYAVHCSK